MDVTIRYPEEAQRDIDTLMNPEIPNQRGGLIPLHHIAHLESKPGTSSIRHKDARRVINVSAEVDQKNMTSKDLNTIVTQRKAEWMGEDADMVKVNLGGEEEKTQE